MPLKYVMSDSLMEPSTLLKAPIIAKAAKLLGDRTFHSMTLKLVNFINDKGHNDRTYHIFALAFGDKGQLPHGHYQYLWENAIKVYGNSNEAKRFLGTLQMYCFCLSDHNWLFIQDPEKKQKLADGQIPDVTEYFIDVTGQGYRNIISKNNFSGNVLDFSALLSKFNKKI